MKPTRFLIAGAVAALLPFAAAVAQSPPPADPSAPDPSAQATQPAQKGATFESLDADSDGRISKTEAAANQSVLDQFSKYDKDGDGFIERSEVTSANKTPPASEPQQ
jgi:hypothetical protein